MRLWLNQVNSGKGGMCQTKHIERMDGSEHKRRRGRIGIDNLPDICGRASRRIILIEIYTVVQSLHKTTVQYIESVLVNTMQLISIVNHSYLHVTDRKLIGHKGQGTHEPLICSFISVTCR